MNLGQLIAEFNAIADNNEIPPTWSNDELRIYFNEAEREACQRARLIKDSRTDEVCLISVTSGEPFYDIDDRVISIRRVKSSLNGTILTPVKFELADRQDPLWEDREGFVTNYIVGMDSRVIRLFPIPTEDQDLHLSVVREPLSEMVNPNDCPEVSGRYHRSLIYWVLYRAYSKKDVEVNEESLSAKNLSLFEAEFGKKPFASALEEEWQMSTGGEFNDGRF
jgi:hypothetical protein